MVQCTGAGGHHPFWHGHRVDRPIQLSVDVLLRKAESAVWESMRKTTFAKAWTETINCVLASQTGVTWEVILHVSMSEAICRFKELGNDGRRPESGRKRTVNSSRNLQQVHNSQNDRIWSVDAPNSSETDEHRLYPKLVMVWCVICARGKTPLVFEEEDVKITQKRTRRTILEAVVLPWAQTHFGNANWAFQKDSAPASQGQKDTRGVEVQGLHETLDSLNQSFLREWDKLKIKDLMPIVENFCKRLRFCIAAKGGHFETN
ncbi:uncharacterized protein TNCV_4972981 [Trichonephila clavipes]|nr:uncharacterized protein TNCV_4972981 [Trichonephila clavipes]